MEINTHGPRDLKKLVCIHGRKMGGVGGRPKFHFARRVFLDRTSTSSDFQDTNSCRISGTFEIFEADRPPDLFGKRTLVESFYCFYLCVYIYI